MHIAELTSLEDALKQPGPLWYLATERGVKSTDIAAAVAALPRGSEVVTFVGPEGGWTDDELRQFEASRAQAVRLTDTILRIETAAVAVAAVFGSLTGWSTMEP